MTGAVNAAAAYRATQAAVTSNVSACAAFHTNSVPTAPIAATHSTTARYPPMASAGAMSTGRPGPCPSTVTRPVRELRNEV